MIADVTDRAATVWQAGERWDVILGALRSEGCLKIDYIRATVEQLRLPLADAKRVTHDSAAPSASRTSWKPKPRPSHGPRVTV